MGEVDRLRARLFGREDRKTLNFNIFPGSDPASPEEVAREVNRALDQIEAGDFDLADIDDPPHTGRQKSTVLTHGFVGLP